MTKRDRTSESIEYGLTVLGLIYIMSFIIWSIFHFNTFFTKTTPFQSHIEWIFAPVLIFLAFIVFLTYTAVTNLLPLTGLIILAFTSGYILKRLIPERYTSENAFKSKKDIFILGTTFGLSTILYLAGLIQILYHLIEYNSLFVRETPLFDSVLYMLPQGAAIAASVFLIPIVLLFVTSYLIGEMYRKFTSYF